jgi:hypothetical protein
VQRAFVKDTSCYTRPACLASCCNTLALTLPSPPLPSVEPRVSKLRGIIRGRGAVSWQSLVVSRWSPSASASASAPLPLSPARAFSPYPTLHLAPSTCTHLSLLHARQSSLLRAFLTQHSFSWTPAAVPSSPPPWRRDPSLAICARACRLNRSLFPSHKHMQPTTTTTSRNSTSPRPTSSNPRHQHQPRLRAPSPLRHTASPSPSSRPQHTSPWPAPPPPPRVLVCPGHSPP